MLIQGAPEDFGQLVKFARKLNDHMTKHAISLLEQTLMSKGVEIKGAKVTVLGVAYKADTEDITNSPAKPIIEELLKTGACVFAYDPYSSETYGAEKASSPEQALRDADCIIVVTNHTDFKSIDARLMRQFAKPDCVIFDGPRLLDPARVKRAGLTYLATGYGTDKHSP